MKFTLSWLKEHLDTNASLNDILLKLTDIGLEVDGLEDRAAQYAPFKVVEVVEAVPHPNADRLRVCQVKTETGIIQVVCGAPNARAGMKAVYAPEGSYIIGLDITLKKTKIRDVESNGMMVSEREMKLGEDQNGIIDLPATTPIGTTLSSIYGLDDPIIEINVTPNRPDCAGVRGIARDLAAAGLGTLKPLNAITFKTNNKSPISVSLNFADAHKDACPLFVGRMITGVKNVKSPVWLQNRLTAIGLRPISALVDITNYFCIGMSRPLHVYDADKLQGNINVHLAKTGEKLAALNDKEYILDETMTVIADDSGVLSLGGIIGGAATGCLDDTTNVFLECAYFDPLRIARTGRALQINSDARYRFERGIDPQSTTEIIDVATQMIIDLCGGVASEVTQAGNVPECRKTIKYDPNKYTKLIGCAVSANEQKTILENLGFVVSNDWMVTTPSWRPDIFGDVDLIEEVARIRGLNEIPATSVVKDKNFVKSAETVRGAKTRKCRITLAGAGMHECVTWSFMKEDLANDFSLSDETTKKRLKLQNPISVDLVQMRPSILPNLIEHAGKNADKGLNNAALFEVGPIFYGTNLNEQPVVATGIRMGLTGDKHWSGAGASRVVDAYDVKSDVLSAITACGGAVAALQVTREAPSWYHPGRSGALKMGRDIIAYFGEIHPEILDKMKISAPVVGFELFIENIPEAKKKGTAKSLLELSPFQPITRDFAFLADAQTPAEMFVKTIKGVERNLITNVEIFDIYTGKGIDAGKKSVAIAVTLQPQEKTLTEAEIEAVSNKIIEAVTQKTGAVLRTC